MKRSVWIVYLAACLSVLTVCANAESPASYRVANRIPVTGDGFWDLLAVDDASGRVFLSHSDVVQVVDEKSGKLVGSVTGMHRVHGIAVAPEFNEGFATSGMDSMVVIFDLGTLNVVKKVRVEGANPDAILYDPSTHHVFAFNGHSNNATVIDAPTRGIVGSVALPGKPELGVADGGGTVFVNLEDTSMVAVIDPKALKVTATWPLAPGKEPSGLAIDAGAHRLFSACNNGHMVVLDSESGKVIATLPIGEHVDGAAFDPGLKRAYASCGDGTLTVVQETDPNTFSVLENATTQAGARTIAVDARTHHLFLPTAEFGETPQPTAEHPRPRPTIKPGSFVLLDVAPGK
jgi:DNA-binding beta-propeller fold protein YncE